MAYPTKYTPTVKPSKSSSYPTRSDASKSAKYLSKPPPSQSKLNIKSLNHYKRISDNCGPSPCIMIDAISLERDESLSMTQHVDWISLCLKTYEHVDIIGIDSFVPIAISIALMLEEKQICVRRDVDTMTLTTDGNPQSCIKIGLDRPS